MAFFGTPVESLDDDNAEDIVTGAMLIATCIDDTRTTRIRIEQYMTAMGKKRK